MNHPRDYDQESPGGSERSGKSRLLVALLESAFQAGRGPGVFLVSLKAGESWIADLGDDELRDLVALR